ncbi:AzlD domain-containing protein [Pengzhenrongella sp.]|uniref:AzlD domain-containing protein n=1 Tax=Pengzhenrongella sp. TaxID=2888820 RepID=UPI002F94D732
MQTIWICIAATALISFGIKAAGPALLGDRPLPDRVREVIALFAPALLFALVVAALLGSHWRAVDSGVAVGVAAAVAARLCRAPTLLAVVVGVGAAALLRAVS